jgi:hypothetical protein
MLSELRIVVAAKAQQPYPIVSTFEAACNPAMAGLPVVGRDCEAGSTLSLKAGTRE